MRIFIFCCLVLTSVGANAQWTVVLDSVQPLNCIFFSSDSVGFAVGDSGTIYKTDDAGLTWTSCSYPTDLSLKEVCFPTPDTGYIVGGSQGIILKTVNQGIEWSEVFNYTKELRSVFFTSAEVGYVVGVDQTILKTVDGGVTWILVNTGAQSDLNSICFTTDNTGYAVGNKGGSGMILKTNNAGIIWLESAVFSEIHNTVFFTDENTGYLGSSKMGPYLSYEGEIYKTIDGGASWERKHTFYGYCRDFSFPNTITGYSTFNSWGNQVAQLRSVDGGNSWAENATGYGGEPTSIFFTSVDTGYITVRTGVILKTTTGGILVNTSDLAVNTRELTIFPNPSSHIINISNLNAGLLRVFNMQSQLLSEIEITDSVYQMDVCNLSPGIYLLMLTNGSQIQTGKFAVAL